MGNAYKSSRAFGFVHIVRMIDSGGNKLSHCRKNNCSCYYEEQQEQYLSESIFSFEKRSDKIHILFNESDNIALFNFIALLSDNLNQHTIVE